MTKKKKFQSLEKGLHLVQERTQQGPLSLEDILHILSGRGRPLLLILLSLPFCQPIQIPGLSTPFGLAIAFIALRTAFGKHVWLPKKLQKKKISPKTISKITNTTLVVIKKIKRFIHPRLDFLCHSRIMEVLNGLTIAILGILLALPLPIPLSNLTAAWSIFIISIGILEDDGLCVLLGYIVLLLTLTFLFFMILTAKKIF